MNSYTVCRIIGYGQLLYELLTDSELKEMANGIIRSSKRMMNTLTNILTLSKYEFNGIEFVPKSVDIIELIENVYTQFSAAAKQKGLNFRKEIKFSSLTITTDEMLLI